MQDIYNELRDTTYLNYQARIDRKKLEQDERPILIEKMIQKIIKDIENNALEKMRNASKEGYYSVSLYTFQPDDTCQEGDATFKYTFLFRGPKYDSGNGNGMEYFEKLNIDPIIPKLKENYNPVRIELVFNTQKKCYNVMAFWNDLKN